ncbi:hypothetical protein G9F32_10265 [Acinetobacter sp. 194]|uniref:hypothetical protein n=1 Tax=Acinetobacter shaoyimingii TaxID=2715164 RepID=UPI00140AD5B9|nr:hypothetical protein [Acinetobacter shaoyimingii]NHB58393.1 hypothetical protein [Acinetobacter shaoyimingii]
MRRNLPLFLLIFSATLSHADLKNYLPDAKIKVENISTWNFGIGMTQKLAHLNAEWVNPYGIGYAKLGAFINDGHEAGGQIGYRYPAFLNGKDYNGFYVGAFGGQLKSKEVGTKTESQFGGGIDLSYVLLNKDRISTISVGLAAGQEVKQGDYVVYESKPELQFSYTLSFGF